MRPPLNAGENVADAMRAGAVGDASMRPPLNAGENVSDSSTELASAGLQ